MLSHVYQNTHMQALHWVQQSTDKNLIFKWDLKYVVLDKMENYA